MEADTTTDADSDADHTSDHSDDSNSESELWSQFDFPQLTPEEDIQLTNALQGSSSQLTTSLETSTILSHNEAMANHSHMHSGVQGSSVHGSSDMSASRSSFRPPPILLCWRLVRITR